MTALTRFYRSPAGVLLVRVLRVAVVVAIIVAVTLAVVSEWSSVSATITALSWGRLGASAALVGLGMAAAVRAWQHVLADLDHPVPAPEAGRIYLVGQLGKYLPGSVWAFVLQVELSKRAGIPRATAFVAVLVTVGLSTTTALVVGLLALPSVLHVLPVLGWVVVATVPVALVCAHPAVLTRLVGLVLAVLRRDPLPRSLTARGVLTAAGWLVASWALYGAHLWLLAGSQGGVGVLGCTGALALGMGAGVLAVVAPSGIGVREAVIAGVLATQLDPGVALGLALASRLVFTLVEVGAGAAAAVSAVVATRRAGGAQTGGAVTPDGQAPASSTAAVRQAR